jgi:predicted peptidase
MTIASAAKPEISADTAIVSVRAIGFVASDGAKLSAIDIEYSVELDGSDVSLDKYTINDYTIRTKPACEIGSDPGAATEAYVKDKTHVIIEVNTDYQLGAVAESYKWAMMAGVTQTGAINARTKIITPGTGEVKNYEVVEVPGHNGVEYRDYAVDGKYAIEGTEVFQLFTKESGTAFRATDCWEEATGQRVAVDLPYALYVPEEYDPRLKYALVLHVHDAGFMGDDPMIALTESQGPVNFASKQVQQIAKAQGLGGAIVVCPQIADALRSTRDDYSLSAAVPATWQLMDYITDTYNIDMDRIYGEGQSMGGMQIGAMAAHRDNYFAAWWANGCQWGSNFNLDDPTYNGKPYYQAPACGDIIWTHDADGNRVDYRNWYYLVSDDNILISNCEGDGFSTSVWKEFKYLYKDLAGAEIPYASFDPLTTSRVDQNAALRSLFAQPNELGIYWAAFEGGNHGATWIYSHCLLAAYEWLLSQTRESELQRGKLELNKPFEPADIQLEEADRAIALTSPAASPKYLKTSKYGAGTVCYNSALYGFSPSGITLIQPPGWLPLP